MNNKLNHYEKHEIRLVIIQLNFTYLIFRGFLTE